MTNGLTKSQDYWASIRRRERGGGGTSYAVLYRLDGGQRTLTFRDNAAAARGVRRRHQGPRHPPRTGDARLRTSERTVGRDQTYFTKSINQHIDALSGVERKTIAEYRRYLTRDISPILGDVPLAVLNRQDISRWVNRLQEAGGSGRTIGNKLGFLSGCLNAAVRDGHTPANPAAGIRLPRTVRREMCFLTQGEINLLKSGFTERWHPLLDLLVSSGCRFSEATALKPADVDREKGTIRIHKAWKRVPDGNGERYELGQPKTRRSTRTVSLPASVIDRLNPADEWVFTNSHGGPIRLYSWRSNVWVPSLAKVATKDPGDPDKVILTKRPRIHDLRHTAASWLLGAGVPLITVSGHLGHEDTSVTAKVYGHLDPAAGNAAAAAMAKMLA